ncbi:MAG: uroporphyrinogen-III C-methyltransferase [Myxococcales bacterium]
MVHPDLLRHANPAAELIFVGKRAGRASERQSNINARLIGAAQAGRRVVRLKGGDPYLFGRGSEEAEALVGAGIPFEVVPGVPSPMAAAAYAGISLTHRDLASSVAYVTATESEEKDGSAHDWSKLATATQTLVFFMGLRRLESLMKRLHDHGRPATTPVAVVSCASLPSQRTVVGTLADIAEKANQAKLEMPALTIVGDVVSLREHLRWFDNQPLFGKRVLITRPDGQSSGLARALREAGADPVELPSIQIVPPRDPALLAQHLGQLGSYQWLVVTSVNGVRAVFDTLRALGRDSRALGNCKVAAIGPATRDALVAYGIRADVVPAEYRGEAVAEAMLATGPLQGQRVLLARAEQAREALPELLRAHGAALDVVPAYRTERANSERMNQIRRRLEEGTIDVVTFTSSSTAEQLVAGLGLDASALLAKPLRAAIGPITAETLANLGLPAHVVANEYTADGLLAALTAHARADGR